MPHNATPPSEQDDQLSPSKWKALEALLVGNTTTEAASIAGVDRSTVHRWLREPVFLASYNGRMAETRESTRAKLDRLHGKALETVERALDRDDSRVALALLRGAGRLDGRQSIIGSDDPNRIAKDQRTAARQQEMQEMFIF